MRARGHAAVCLFCVGAVVGRGVVPQAWRSLAEALWANSTLRTLLLDGNIIGRDGWEAMAAGLLRNEGVEMLSLARNGLTPEGCSALAAAVGRNGHLQSLTLDSNYFGDEQLQNCRAIGNALAANEVLTALSLADCEIRSDVVHVLAGALGEAPGSRLATLDLQSNELSVGVALVLDDIVVSIEPAPMRGCPLSEDCFALSGILSSSFGNLCICLCTHSSWSYGCALRID